MALWPGQVFPWFLLQAETLRRPSVYTWSDDARALRSISATDRRCAEFAPRALKIRGPTFRDATFN